MTQRFLYSIIAFLAATACYSQVEWRQTNGPQDGSINSLVRDSAGMVYFSSDLGFKSDDEGRTWTRTRSQLLYMTRTDLAGGEKAGVLYSFFTGIPSGLLRSTDEGRTWTRLSERHIGVNPQIHALAAKHDTLFMSDNGAVLRYIHSSASWDSIPIVAGGTDQPENKVRSFAPAPNGDLFAATHGGVYRSSDNGEHWTMASKGIGADIVRTVHAASNGDLYAITATTLFRSTDGGNQWNPAAINIAGRGRATITTKGSDLVFLGSVNGLFARSTDGGVTWTENDHPGMFPTSILVTRTGDLVIGTIFGGMFRSDDDGLTWRRHNSGLASASTAEIGVAPNGRIYALTYSYVGESDSIVNSMSMWTTLDRGETWTPTLIGELPTCGSFSMIVLGDDEVILGTGCAGILHTTDAGLTWRRRSSESMKFVEGFVRLKNGDLLASTSFGSPYVSSDMGLTWRTTGTIPGRTSSLFAHSSGRVIAGSDKGAIHYSSDNGQTWTAADAPGISVRIASITEGLGGRLFAATQSQGVYQSLDSGLTWNATGTQALRNLGNNQVQIFPDRNGDLYLAGYEFRLLKSTDMGKTWNDSPAGLGQATWKGLARDSMGYLWAGVSSSGVYHSTRATASVDPRLADADLATALVISPNPVVSSRTTLSLTLQTGAMVRIRIYDPVGHQIASLVDRRLESGSHEFPLNLQDARPGAYYYLLDVDDRVSRGSFIIAR